jgi:hypothetical protein
MGLPRTTRFTTAPALLTAERLSVLRSGHERVFGIQDDELILRADARNSLDDESYAKADALQR